LQARNGQSSAKATWRKRHRRIIAAQLDVSIIVCCSSSSHGGGYSANNSPMLAHRRADSDV